MEASNAVAAIILIDKIVKAKKITSLLNMLNTTTNFIRLIASVLVRT